MSLELNINGPGDPKQIERGMLLADFGPGQLLAYAEVLEAVFDGDALDLDEEEVGEVGEEGVEDVDEEDGEPEISLPPATKKSAAPRKSVPETEANHQNAKPPVAAKVETPAKAGPAATKVAPGSALHVVAPSKPVKVHVMAKPAKSTPPSPTRAPSHAPKPAPGHAHGHAHAAAGSHGTAAKKALPLKAAPAKPVAKPAPSKSVPAKAVRRPVGKPVPPSKPSAKSIVPLKKTAAKAPVKLHKKPEPAKKAAPAKKAPPAKKHR